MKNSGRFHACFSSVFLLKLRGNWAGGFSVLKKSALLVLWSVFCCVFCGLSSACECSGCASDFPLRLLLVSSVFGERFARQYHGACGKSRRINRVFGGRPAAAALIRSFLKSAQPHLKAAPRAADILKSTRPAARLVQRVARSFAQACFRNDHADFRGDSPSDLRGVPRPASGRLSCRLGSGWLSGRGSLCSSGAASTGFSCSPRSPAA